MGYFLGVDLGTTYTAAAIRRDDRTEITALSDRSPAIPSVLLLDEDGTLHVGDAANRRAIARPDRWPASSPVRRPRALIVGGTPYGADLLTARLLRWVVDLVSQREGRPPTAWRSPTRPTGAATSSNCCARPSTTPTSTAAPGA